MVARFASLFRRSVSPHARYEGAQPNRSRSYLPTTVQNANRDLDRYTRRELLAKARYLYRNAPLTRAMIERLVVYTIGTGIHPTPASSDEQFNARALRAWREWTKRPDIYTRNSYSTIQRIRCRAAMLDGDIFSVLTYGTTGRPRIQIIESHNITSSIAGGIVDADGVNLIDGRAASYIYVPDLAFGRGESYTIPADVIVQHINPERANQHRGVTILASAINYAHDVEDTVALEKQAVKELSANIDTVYNASGEVEDDEPMIGRALRPETTDADGTHEAAVRYYRENFGASTRYLRNGDKREVIVPGRPSPAWQGFMDYLQSTICLSTGLPPSVLLGVKIGGADTRRELATAQRVIEVWQQVFAEQEQRIYEYVIGAEIDAGFLGNPPSDWRNVEWQYPARVTVDAGREAAADRDDVKAGLLTRREYFGRWGQDWREQMRQSAIEAAQIKALAEEYGVTPEEIAQRYPNPPQVAQAQPQEVTQ